MATVKLIGRDDSSCSWANWNNYAVWDRFTCSVNGSCIELRVKLNGNCDVKVALYIDNSGTPGTLLAKKDVGTSCVAGWNAISFESPCDLTSGTKYWLACAYNMSGSYAGYLTQTSDGHKLKSITYSSWTWVDNPPDLTTNNAYISILAGWGILVISPSSISQPASCGSPRLNLSLKSSSIVQQLTYGTTSLVTAKILIGPQSITVIVSNSVPILHYPQIISMPGINQPVAVGIPYIPYTVIVGILSPQGISVIIDCGSPTILKYVWHIILDGHYTAGTPPINRTYIVGKDQYANPVYGSAIDSSEVDLVGERLDFQQEVAIPTDIQAASMASAILSKMRLTKARGAILVPPNCGQELFDVVQISDAGANQSAVSFRVLGIHFEYNPKQARFEHRLFLSGF